MHNLNEKTPPLSRRPDPADPCGSRVGAASQRPRPGPEGPPPLRGWKTHAGLLVATLWAVLLGGSGCAVRSVYVKPDFQQVDRQNLKRITVAVTPLPGAPAQASALLARMARRFVHQHKDFLAAEDQVIPSASAWKALCDGELHGVLRLQVHRLDRDDGALQVDMTADLLRCDSSVLVWKVEIDDENDSRDDNLKELASVYRREFGQVADTYAAPFFILVQAAFASLPSPQLTDEETMEKIEME